MPKTLLAAPAALLALATIGCGATDDPTPVDRAASTTTAATAVPAATTTTATTPGASTSTSPAPGSILGSNGKMYRCLGPGLLSDLRALNRRIDRGRRSLRRIRPELRRLKRRYPGKVAPRQVAQRYNYLVRKHNGLVRLGNRRVRAYNARLERDCVRG